MTRVYMATPSSNNWRIKNGSIASEVQNNVMQIDSKQIANQCQQHRTIFHLYFKMIFISQILSYQVQVTFSLVYVIQLIFTYQYEDQKEQFIINFRIILYLRQQSKITIQSHEQLLREEILTTFMTLLYNISYKLYHISQTHLIKYKGKIFCNFYYWSYILALQNKIQFLAHFIVALTRLKLKLVNKKCVNKKWQTKIFIYCLHLCILNGFSLFKFRTKTVISIRGFVIYLIKAIEPKTNWARKEEKIKKQVNEIITNHFLTPLRQIKPQLKDPRDRCPLCNGISRHQCSCNLMVCTSCYTPHCLEQQLRLLQRDDE
ncbi:Transposase_IS4 [Hexamita inflata]|uniref:Transposase IS4 n=1 Tax=Hexamita inflata TaxID=28002 RepID=A0AA86NVW4_9EUKA|nr:Transposase IS4 [Hexamita inflata]